MALGPELRVLDRTRVLHEGKPYLFFGGTDYHRLSSHPDVLRAVHEAADAEGLSCAGSRTTTGNHPLVVELEHRLASFLGASAAVTCPTGYLSNAMALDVLAGEFPRFFIDASAHSSMAAPAARLPREALLTFRHADPEDLEHLLKDSLRPGEKPLILTDGVVPVDGELPPLGAYWELVKQFGGALLVDDAHGIAVVGPDGKGSPAEAGLPAEAVIQAGTLSKGLGTFGGVVAGPTALPGKVCERSLTFVGATPIPPPFAAAAIRSMEILRANPGMLAGLRARVLRARERLRSMGFRMVSSPAPILSVTHRDADKNLRLRALLVEGGIYPTFSNYPGSPPGGHFRFALSSAHTEEEIGLLLDTISLSCG